jgi:hypothetical protein
VNCVDLVWSAILASMSNAKPAEEALDDPAMVNVEPEAVKGTPILQAIMVDDIPPPLLVDEPLVLTEEEVTLFLETEQLEVVSTQDVGDASGAPLEKNSTTYALT